MSCSADLKTLADIGRKHDGPSTSPKFLRMAYLTDVFGAMWAVISYLLGAHGQQEFFVIDDESTHESAEL